MRRPIALAERTNPNGAKVSHATLSVVMTSSRRGGTTLQAARVLAERCPTMQAQLIVVASGGVEPATSTLLESVGATIVVAPASCTRAEMCDLGMKRASGSIVAVRDDADVGDGQWLDAYARILPCVESPVVAREPERTVLETQLVRGSQLVDAPVASHQVAAESRAAAMGIAAAV